MRIFLREIASRQSLAEGMLALYKRWLSPLFGNSCRFSPTCAEYTAEAMIEHGWSRGAALGLRRLLRCHPFGGAGFDPVPSCSHCRQLRP